MSTQNRFSAAGQHRRCWSLALVVVATLYAHEVLAGGWSGPLALLADGCHMAAEFVTLATPLVATGAVRPDRSDHVRGGLLRAVDSIDHNGNRRQRVERPVAA